MFYSVVLPTHSWTSVVKKGLKKKKTSSINSGYPRMTTAASENENCFDSIAYSILSKLTNWFHMCVFCLCQTVRVLIKVDEQCG